MTLKTTILIFAALTMGAVGQAATYHVTLLRPTFVSGQELQPGDYKIEVSQNTAVISHGKLSVQAAVSAVQGDRKFDTTTIRYEVDGAKYMMREIGIGGTKTKLIIRDTPAVVPIS